MRLPWLIAAVAFLARHGIKVPEQVSLVCTDSDAMVDWCHPPIARMQWDIDSPSRATWCTGWTPCAKARPIAKSSTFPAEFVPGGSIGPVWKG